MKITSFHKWFGTERRHLGTYACLTLKEIYSPAASKHRWCTQILNVFLVNIRVCYYTITKLLYFTAGYLLQNLELDKQVQIYRGENYNIGWYRQQG